MDSINKREERDLYNDSKEVTGKTFFKGEEIPEGYYELIVVIVLEDLDGNYVIQKRSKQKGGKWALTGGHPKHGESSLDGIREEVKEEIGFNIDNDTPMLFTSFNRKNKFFDLYYLKKDVRLSDLTRQESEVEEIKIVNKEEIFKLNELGKFHKDNFYIFKMFLDWKDYCSDEYFC